MEKVYNIYCDESCHLENDNSNIMVLGAITCPYEVKQKVFQDIRKLKIEHGLSSWYEIKWTSVSPSKIDFYLEVIEYFLNNDSLNFRSIVAKHKKQLTLSYFGDEGYDGFYYRMYYYLLDRLVNFGATYNIFLDIKDTNGGKKIDRLHQILSNKLYDFDREIIKRISLIHSIDSEILQITDLIIGAIGYYHRGLYLKKDGSDAKRTIIEKLIKTFGEDVISNGTPPYEKKFNIFIWMPRGWR